MLPLGDYARSQMPAETVYICIRRTADWKDTAGYRARLIAGFVPHVNAWDATFRTCYQEFRAAIADITMDSLRAVRGAVIAPYDDVPEGAIVMPCDDDDWTAPMRLKFWRSSLPVLMPVRFGLRQFCRFRSTGCMRSKSAPARSGRV